MMVGKWELVEENKLASRFKENFVFGVVERGDVFVDVYRNLNWRGIYKYKFVKRSK